MYTRFFLLLALFIGFAQLTYSQQKVVSQQRLKQQKTPASPHKVALLIHIDTFLNKNHDSLVTAGGLKLVRDALKRQKFTIYRELKNQQATIQNIHKVLASLIEHLQGKKGAIVTIVLDSHGEQVPDLNGDEQKKTTVPSALGVDLKDEAFVAFDSPKSMGEAELESLRKTNLSKLKDYIAGFLIDDELATYYDQIRCNIGSQGHLVVVQPGCHSYSGMRGNEGKLKITQRWAPDEAIPNPGCRPEEQGKLFYFSSTEDDSYKVNTDHERTTSALLYPFSKALDRLSTGITYEDLCDMIVDIRQDEQTEVNPYYNPALSQDSDKRLPVFRGFITPADQLTQFVTDLTLIKLNFAKLFDSFWNKKQTRSGRTRGPNEATVPENLVVINDGMAGGFAPGQVVEFADTAGNSVVSGVVVAADNVHALVQLDRANSLVNLSVRRPSLTLRLYADASVPASLRIALNHWVALTQTPQEAQLRLTCPDQSGAYTLCASGLPYSQNGCTSLSDDKTVLRKLRGLVVYQILRSKERRDSISIFQQQARWVSGKMIKLKDTISLKSCYDKIDEGWRRIDLLEILPNKPTFVYQDHLVVDTIQSSLVIKTTEAKPNQYVQYLDILPDQYTKKPGGPAYDSLGRELVVQSSYRGNNTIDIACFSPPFGLEENAFVFSSEPINLQDVLDGKVRPTDKLLNQIQYVIFSYHYILPDRTEYQVK
ncbi:hypothetical protein GCM10028805_37800 [Spirosoma harenae]